MDETSAYRSHLALEYDDEGPDWQMSWDEHDAGIYDDERLRLADLGKLARRTRRRIIGVARADDRPSFVKLLTAHLGPVDALEVVEESWPGYDHVNVQVGLDIWLSGEGRTHELLGVGNFRHAQFGLGDLLAKPDPDEFLPRPGNVTWTNLSSGPAGQVYRGIRAGLYLVSQDELRAAILLLGADPESGRPSTQVHLVADRTGAANEIAADIRRLALEHNVFRGQVISFGEDVFGERQTALQFQSRPTVTADDVVLPSATLEMVRRQVVGVAQHRERLLAARQHLKRGLLLYGPPGVGKTHTVRYLISELDDLTIVELSGDALRLISMACSVARTLQPAMIVVEDVDLIAEDRGKYPGQHPLLFQLLNEMDGLAQDADVVFLLTTNRADLLESALAARPGRVDQAVLMELPDVEGRRRLFDLYRGALSVDESRLDAVLERTEGVTASFLKELLRRSALIAVADPDGPPGDGPLAVSADHLDAALDELLDTRNAMTRALLGGGRS